MAGREEQLAAEDGTVIAEFADALSQIDALHTSASLARSTASRPGEALSGPGGCAQRAPLHGRLGPSCH